MSKDLSSIKAVLFDFDGVICNSETHWARLESELWEVFDAKPESEESTLGRSHVDLYEHISKRVPRPVSFEDFSEKFYLLCDRIYSQLAQPQPGVRSLLSELDERSVDAYVVSSCDRRYIDQVLDRFGLASFVSGIVALEDVGGRTKPDPFPYLLAQRSFALDADSTLVVEDSATGISSARSAGLQAVLYGEWSDGMSVVSFESHGRLAEWIRCRT